MTKHIPPPGDGDGDRIIDEPLTEALSRRYLAYALSTITGRALPDVRDGSRADAGNDRGMCRRPHRCPPVGLRLAGGGPLARLLVHSRLRALAARGQPAA